MQRQVNQRFCLEHMIFERDANDERVPCPLDGKHSIWLKDLKGHLKKCNARPKVSHDLWFVKDVNIRLTGDDSVVEGMTGKSNDKELYTKHIPLLENLKFEPLEMRKSQHQALDTQFEGLSNHKHILQQSLLIGHMKEKGMLDLETFYIEFGCGRAELSRYVNICALSDGCKNVPKILQQKSIEAAANEDVKAKVIDAAGVLNTSYGYGMIDRGVNRMKLDPKLVKDCLDQGITPIMKRSRIDIKDLNLDKFIGTPKKIVCISKHLCGAATDLTLKCLINSSVFDSGTFGGLLIAMCCRHACLYEQLLPESRAYLAERGFPNGESFYVLKKMVTWAVCGRKENIESEHISGKSYDEREAIGFLARRLIDESRVHALQLLLPKYNVEMFAYAETSTTLENVGLCIK